MSIKGFKFSLEAPLKVKKIHKTKMEKELANAKDKMDAGKRMLDKLQNEELRLYSRLSGLISEGIRASELQTHILYLKDLEGKIAHQQLEYDRLRKAYLGIQRALIKILNEIDMLDKMKEERLKEYLKEIENKEQKELEERINYKSSVQGGMMYG
ncbi:MAG: hypothetical protein GX375_03895 [Clostridiales bacterium]|nr:hypothetical protein [Clostridiales bacterium]